MSAAFNSFPRIRVFSYEKLRSLITEDINYSNYLSGDLQISESKVWIIVHLNFSSTVELFIGGLFTDYILLGSGMQ